MTTQNKVMAGLYCRLSRDDNNGSLVSMSIENQQGMLQDYAAEKEWNVYDIYIDDGYSGVNFERPNFQRMLKDAEAGRINCIITKDLSRLGRNYVQTGHYTDEYFPELGVRYIAINDGIDTLEDNNDIAAFHHVLNELYPKQVSKKVRQVKTASAKQGKFMGSQAPYGYMKSPEDKHKLIIDEEAALFVRRLFQEFAGGDSGRMIADRLNGEGLDSPRFYHYAKLGRVNPLAKEKNVWGSATVLQLLRNQVYIGHMVQGKRQVVSFKTKKCRPIDPENWIVVENTHEPIVSQELWDRVHQRLSTKRRANRTKRDTVGLFAGVVVCSDCKSSLAYMRKQLKDREKGVYRCSRYNNNGGGACSPHYIDEEFLAAFVLNDIRLHAKLAAAEKEQLTQRLLKAMSASRDAESRTLLVKKKEMEHRLSVIASNLKNLYGDKCAGKLPEQVFFGLMNDYTKEQTGLEDALAALTAELKAVQSTENEIAEWIGLVEKQTDIQTLDRVTVMELIETIEVGEKVKENGKRTQEISIEYRFIGNLLQNAKEDIA